MFEKLEPRIVSYASHIKTIRPMGIDAGNGEVKVVGYAPVNGSKWVEFQLKMRSLVKQGKLIQHLKNETEDGLIEVQADKKTYVIGSTDMPLPTTSWKYQSGEARAALVYAAAAKAITTHFKDVAGKENQLSLAVSMMASYYWSLESDGMGSQTLTRSQEKVQRLQAAMSSNFYLTGDSWPLIRYQLPVTVIGETMAAILSLLLSDKGELTGIHNPGDEILIADGGYGDTAFLHVVIGENGLPKIKQRFVESIGVDKTVTSVLDAGVDDYKRKHHGAVNSDMRHMTKGSELLYRGKVKLFGKELSLLPFKEEGVNAMAAQLASAIDKYCGTAGELSAIYLVGGFPELAWSVFGDDYFQNEESGFKDFHNVIIPKEPSFANARGLLRANLFLKGNGNVAK
jgi:hypothetical protein